MFIIAAASGRSLSASAGRAGLRAHVLDWFADQDTRASAAGVHQVGTPRTGFDAEQLLAAARRVSVSSKRPGLVVGSGFEDRLELLASLARGRRLCGNPTEVVRRVKDPEQFFGLLKRLGVPHPETAWHPVAAPAGWLQKRIGGAGGAHVRPLPGDGRCPAGYYLQRQVSGRPFSAVFLADGTGAVIIGYNELWHAKDFGQSPFLYGGAVALPGIDERAQSQVTDTIQELVAALGLRGLCGLDLIIDEDARWYALELNPRPPATFELHEPRGGLFRAHLLACDGTLPKPPFNRSRYSRAHAVLHATRPTRILASGWPAWTADRPAVGTQVAYGGPICTVHAQELDSPTAKRRVTERLCLLDAGLRIWRTAA